MSRFVTHSDLYYSHTFTKRPHKMSSLGRVRALGPYWVKLLPHKHMITAETYPTHVLYFYPKITALPIENFPFLVLPECDNVTTPYHPIFAL